MTKADRAALRKRVWTRLYESGSLAERIANFCAREIDRAVRRERKRVASCRDCGAVFAFPQPPLLCEGCADTRSAEGMDLDDERKISTWRRT